ncbi:MAG: histidine utilization repressor [Rhodobacteraceae bacterium]|jgi:GntR family histidine utilization transcriptional repressor|uniref:Transcriptional regulator, GntR family n=1 Tax=Salipiger profundus TaxID=1229727 RepID=A0A1U7D4B3_9RHOB|nr:MULTISPECIES: UTRA domain-containing protein [Salipiger]APX23004.1 transcriptional regulator, GntR family [Salipiger profundus]MAB04667.1 histidine utilization repressor [Paracoccaceae bacterium]GGA12621.1 histidine utilization repressor [Salipiger profundus]SFD21579.1 transcriptional regulator, GntR family [Salipiger profundus]
MSADRDTETTKSLHETILTDLERNILSGDWAPGHRVPSELELAEQYGCSRMTVNKVMTQLAQAGLVLRRRRAGSVVLPQRSQNAVLEIHDVKEEVLAAGGWYGHEILGRRERPLRAEEAVAGAAPGVPVLDVACLHRKDDAPFCLERRVIFLDAVPEAAEATFDAQAPGAWLLAHVPWSEAENEIGAEAADTDVAARLGLAAGAPLLTMTRRTWKNGEPVTQARFFYPGGGHTMKARFTPSQS